MALHCLKDLPLPLCSNDNQVSETHSKISLSMLHSPDTLTSNSICSSWKLNQEFVVTHPTSLVDFFVLRRCYALCEPLNAIPTWFQAPEILCLSFPRIPFCGGYRDVPWGSWEWQLCLAHWAFVSFREVGVSQCLASNWVVFSSEGRYLTQMLIERIDSWVGCGKEYRFHKKRTKFKSPQYYL